MFPGALTLVSIMSYTPSPVLLEAAAYLSSAPSLAKVSNTTKLEVEQVRYLGDYKLLTTWVLHVDSYMDCTSILASRQCPRTRGHRSSM